MRKDESNNEEERRGLWPIEEMKGKQDGDCKKTRIGIPGLY
jgi:hypothetical protein